ncbi:MULTISPECIES: nuclear transport factor 2 family protein [unclassified Sphingobium]|uniref:nuclear transport factor 2 family protein n=1 Tax=unclassified Sphingobium TaxID=2611147 RepID=UPI002224B335|nr:MULTISPECIES: nuclear transport factor 2 family protein [unclassified Sphingobium]MCW2381053.1 putative SnoaL-like aldol condensation-catalyzing enzyme [Sphingobium sp. B2D3B]MCW2398840.1 putative SnoaL-like aldol condensation-catalyzing enzyme [Sphingobium sp. B2D3C]
MSQAITDRDAQLALLESADPQLAANKRLVWDMYRTVLQAGHADRAADFIAEGYIQHNPNVASGRQPLVDFIKGSRPVREIEERIMLPLVNIIAERDMVMCVFERPEKDAEGQPYVTSWFDLFRIENGMIAEHWDPALKSVEMLKFDPNSKRTPPTD